MKEIKLNRHNLLILILWFLGGVSTLFVASYLFLYYNAMTFPVFRQVIQITEPYSIIKQFVVFIHPRILEFLLALLFSVGLSFLTGFKKIWLFSYLAGLIVYPLYLVNEAFVVYLRIYPELPSWTIAYYIQSMIAYLILIPLLSWLGCILGSEKISQHFTSPVMMH